MGTVTVYTTFTYIHYICSSCVGVIMVMNGKGLSFSGFDDGFQELKPALTIIQSCSFKFNDPFSKRSPIFSPVLS